MKLYIYQFFGYTGGYMLIAATTKKEADQLLNDNASNLGDWKYHKSIRNVTINLKKPQIIEAWY